MFANMKKRALAKKREKRLSLFRQEFQQVIDEVGYHSAVAEIFEIVRGTLHPREQKQLFDALHDDLDLLAKEIRLADDEMAQAPRDAKTRLRTVEPAVAPKYLVERPKTLTQ